MARKPKPSTQREVAAPVNESQVFVARNVLTPELCAAIIPRFKWTGSLGPAGFGNRCTQGHAWQVGDLPAEARSEREVFEVLFRQLLEADVLPLKLEQVASWRGWASATPAGVEIRRHGHDADFVRCVYLGVPEDAEPLEFVQGGPLIELPPRPAVLEPYVDPPATVVESVVPEVGMVLQWPSSLEHRVLAGPLRAGERTCAAWNITLRRAA